MKLKTFLCALILNLCLVNSSIAEQVIDEDTIKGISQELINAVKQEDISVFEKYLYVGSKIVVDLDPALNRGKQEISYDEYMEMAKMSLGFMKEAKIHNEIITLEIDEAKNQGSIEEKTTVIVEAMGTKIEDVSLTKTTYGIVDGQIKVLETENELISSLPIE